MYGNYRNSGIIRLRTYEQAKEWHDKTEPFRGKGVNAGIKPLGHRNRPQFSIRMDGDNVVCRLYKTDVVTYHPDNTISIKDDGYTSQTTANFIDDLLVPARIQDHNIILFGGTKPTRLIGTAKIAPIPNTLHYTVLETGKHYTHSINRKRMSELRKTVAPFMKYASGMLKLREYTFEQEEVNAGIQELGVGTGPLDNTRLGTDLWRESPAEMRKRMVMLYGMVTKGDAENWYNPLLWLVRSSITTYWRNLHVTEAQVKRLMDDILIALHPDVLEVAETPAGTIKIDKYARFKPFIKLSEEKL